MGRIPTIAVLIAAVVLLGGANYALYHFLAKPWGEEVAAARADYEQAYQTAQTLDQVQAAYDEAVDEWLAAQADWEHLMVTRSTPVSFTMPTVAMIALWREYREVLPKEIEQFIQGSGVQLMSGTSFPAPPGVPPSPPPSGFLQIPEGTITLTIAGTLEQIERFYHSIGEFNRVMTIGSFGLTGEGDQLQTQVAMNFYLPVELAPGAPAAPVQDWGVGTTPGMPGMPGMPEGPPGMPGGPGGMGV